MKLHCDTCGYELRPQPLPIIDAGHECPKRGASNKVTTFKASAK